MQSKEHRIVYLALGVSWLIIFAGIRWVFFRGEPTSNIEPSDMNQEKVIEADNDKIRYYVDQGVILEGIISKYDGFTQYSHNFESKGNKFGLKSSSIDLFDYSGSVRIKGTVTEFIDGIPVIKVEDIVSSKETDLDKNDNSDKKSVHYFHKDGLAIDLTPTNGYVVEQTPEDIKIVDVGGENPIVILSISSFGCDKANSLTDCEGLQEKFSNIGADSFVSKNGIKYTNMTETSTWLAFDNVGKGYYFRPSGEKELTQFVDLISMVNNKTVTSSITSKVEKTCKDLDHSIESIENLDYEDLDNGNIKITVEGKNASGSHIITCSYEGKIGSTIQYSHLGTVVEENTEYVEPEEIAEEIKEEEEDDNEKNDDEDGSENGNENEIKEEEEDDNSASIVDEGIYEGQLSFSSARGYTMYFSDKGIGYVGTYLGDDEKLSTGGVSCGYGVKITNWKNIDAINKNTDSIIYECAGDIQLGELEEGITYIDEVDGKHFIKKDFSSKYAGMEVGILSK